MKCVFVEMFKSTQPTRKLPSTIFEHFLYIKKIEIGNWKLEIGNLGKKKEVAMGDEQRNTVSIGGEKLIP